MQVLQRGITAWASELTTSSLRTASKVVCVGRNYADHIKELHNPVPQRPFFFLKPPSAILLPGDGPVLRPTGTELHHEVELAVVIGRDLRNLDPLDTESAFAAIHSYVVAIDMTARNLQAKAKQQGLPWTAAKGFDTFLPLSRPITKAALPDLHAAELFLFVNGFQRQYGSTGLMLFPIPTLLAHISAVMSLRAGDIVLTGTPAGVAAVEPGDTMRAGVMVDGREVTAGRIEVRVENATGLVDFSDA